MGICRCVYFWQTEMPWFFPRILLDILHFILEKFPNAQRITSYGTAQDVLRKSDEELSALKDAGLEMIYMGAESGG
ncbi:MAG: hypothetical protein V8R80_01510 [Eubacterium sp.]